jgi:hypothetical protein
MHHWIIDNLPAVECTSNCRGGVEYHEQPYVVHIPPCCPLVLNLGRGCPSNCLPFSDTCLGIRRYYRLGFPVGCAIGEARKSMTICTVNTISNMYPEEVFVNNHIDLVIDFHESTEFTGARIVGVQVSALAPLCPSSCFPPLSTRCTGSSFSRVPSKPRKRRGLTPLINSLSQDLASEYQPQVVQGGGLRARSGPPAVQVDQGREEDGSRVHILRRVSAVAA